MIFSSIRQTWNSRFISSCLIAALIVSFGVMPQARAQGGVLGLPQPGTMVNLSPAYVPLMLTGLTIHPENPLLMDFIVSTGNSGLNAQQVKKESNRLIKYFLACLTIPEDNQWVNLSPYENQHIIPKDLGQTVLGRDMLAQDYLLKQLTASLIYPGRDLGKDFWDAVYAKAARMYGTTQIPVNTFNKVWILPDTAKVYSHGNTVFVVKSHLKVMLDEDYLALSKHAPVGDSANVNNLGAQVVRQVILPAIEKEVNTGKNFARMRQIYNSMILAFWFKQNLKHALLNQVYTDKSKVNGVNVSDPAIQEKIYNQYVQAYKRGVFNFIKEETDPATEQTVPRKYFSGGLTPVRDLAMATPAEAKAAFEAVPGRYYTIKGLTEEAGSGPNAAMLAELRAKGVPEAALQNIEAGVLSSAENLATIKLLVDIGEQDLMRDLDAPGINDDKKKSFLDQVSRKNKELQGGLAGYKGLVRNLLKNAKDVDPTDGYTPQVPQGKVFDGINQDYLDYTQRGVGYLNQLVLVKVAGGAGDRLGYNGPKVGIPVDLITGEPFLQKDAEEILAKQKAYLKMTGRPVEIPFIIMTSDKTHDATIKMLEEHHSYGLRGYSVVDSTQEVDPQARLGQIILIRQNMVPLVKDMNASLSKEGQYKLGENPRGHGDIHEMLYRSGLVKYFQARGKAQLLFYQDTNVETWNAILPLLANAVERGDDMNLVGVKRKPGEATGILMTLTGNPLTLEDLDKVSGGLSGVLMGLLQQKGYVGPDHRVLVDTIDYVHNNIPGFESMADKISEVLKEVKARQGKVITRNIEYNFINKRPKLKAIESQYAGNINVFTMKIDSWLAAVEKTKGQVPFLLNPKTKPGSEELAKPMRAENNMQDAAVWFDGSKVGVTSFEPRFVFAALKNDYPESYKRLKDGAFLESPFAVEGMYYQNNRRIAAQMGGVTFPGAGIQGIERTIPFEIEVKKGNETVKEDVQFPWFDGAKFVYTPGWAPTILDVRDKLSGGVWSSKAVVRIEGDNIYLKNVDVDGTLIIKAGKGVEIHIDGLKVQNPGWSLDNLWKDVSGAKRVIAEGRVPQYLIQRGFQLVKHSPGLLIDIQKPGRYMIDAQGEVARDGSIVGQLTETGITIPQDSAMAHNVVEEEAQITMGDSLLRAINSANDSQLKGVIRMISNSGLPERELEKLNRAVKIRQGVLHKPVLAEAEPGGIDLNSRNLNLESVGSKVNITFDPAMIAQFRRGNFSGVEIQILNVLPVNLKAILALD